METSEPHPALLELGQIRFDNTDLNGVLLKVAELAKRAIAKTSDVSVTLVRDQRAFTAAFTGADALALDESQYDAGYGPCLEVAQSTGVINIPDMAAEPLWPTFTKQALAHGLRCSLSIALPVQESVVGVARHRRLLACTSRDDAHDAGRQAGLHPVLRLHASGVARGSVDSSLTR